MDAIDWIEIVKPVAVGVLLLAGLFLGHLAERSQS